MLDQKNVNLEQENVNVVRRWVELLSRWGADPQDIPRVFELIDPDCEWVLMATGERYRGTDAIRKISQQSASAVSHSEQHKLEVTNLFGCGDNVCLEYVHGALLTLPGQTEPTPIEMPICIVFQCKNGRIIKANEYYEIEHMKGPNTIKPVYGA